MREVKKEGLTGGKLLPPPPLAGEGKQLLVWILGVGAKFRPTASETVYQIVEITKGDVVVASDKEHWAVEHDTLVYLI